MSRNQNFSEGQQLDLLTEHYRKMASQNPYVAPPHQVGLASDKNNNLVYLSLSQDREDPESHEIYAHHADGPGYSYVGQLGTMRTDSVETAPHEVGYIQVTPDHRRTGIASAMWHFGRQFLDLRHSDERTDAGAAWTHAVGGPDLYGQDTSTYRHPGETGS